MKKKSLIILIFLLIFLLFISGCINNVEETIDTQIEDEYDFYVDGDFTSDIDGFGIDHFDTILGAINNSSSGSKIFVHSGVYYESLIINHKLMLNGENANTTIIDGIKNEEDIITIDAEDGTIISNFTFQNNNGENKYYTDAAIDLRSNNNIIKNNIFKNNICGIYTKYSHENSILKNKFFNNSEYGIYFHTSSNDNAVSDNYFLKNNYALRIKGNRNCQVSHNAFVNNLHGIYLCCGANYNFVYENLFCNNTEWDAEDHYNNVWDTATIPEAWFHNTNLNIEYDQEENVTKGNYWDKFHLPSQGAFDNNSDNIIDTAYDIPHGYTDDYYPLANPPVISNPFFKKENLPTDCLK